MIHNQSTHWYRPKGSIGWTANPEYALDGEVEKRGLHDCTVQNCAERHGSSAQEIADARVRSSQVTRKAKGH